MNAISSAAASASSSTQGTVQGAASVAVLKKAIATQASSALQLIQSLPQPELASGGSVGTQVNRYA